MLNSPAVEEQRHHRFLCFSGAAFAGAESFDGRYLRPPLRVIAERAPGLIQCGVTPANWDTLSDCAYTLALALEPTPVAVRYFAIVGQ